MNDYIFGILYGDGSLQFVKNQETLTFSTTHKELTNKVIKTLKKNRVKYSHITRTYESNEEKANYEILEILNISDQHFLKTIKDYGYYSNKPEERIKITPEFIRGYIETKGSLFKSHSRGKEFWRISISGNYGDLVFLKNSLEDSLQINFGQVQKRMDKEKYGVSSNAYRLSTQSRAAVSKIIEFIEGNDMSEYLRNKINSFDQFNTQTPFNMKRKVFKHYKNAVTYMAKELNLTIKGIRGGSSTKGFRPVYLWEGNDPILCFKGWEGAYRWVLAKYEKETGYDGPSVK